MKMPFCSTWSGRGTRPRLKLRHANRVEQNLDALAGLLAQRRVAGDEPIRADLAQLNDDVSAYRSDFATLAALLEARGTGQSGFEGEFRANARAVEELLVQHDDQPGLQMALLV